MDNKQIEALFFNQIKNLTLKTVNKPKVAKWDI